MVAALVSHLVRQGIYRNEDVAVLTPYLGQLQKLKQRLGSSFAIVVGDRDLEELETKGLEDDSREETNVTKGNVRKTTLLNALRIASVDNFQGEEAKVIIISLVRSNDERKCGFLKTSNRINVLLSRARHGMYIIGNTQTARPVPMWNKVITILEKDGNIGRTLALCCPRHKETPIEVSKPDDFSIFSPEGGCSRKCISRLGCGHACINKCHSEPLHNSVRCLERCQRMKKGCDHACAKVCGDPCDSKCRTKVPNITLACGHVQTWLACHLAQAPETVLCHVSVQTVLPGCKHTVKVYCYELPLAANYPCNATCGAALECGHNCKQICKNCNTRGEDGRISDISHGICKTPCGRQYNTCSHACSEACHGDKPCQLCSKPCEVRCSHSRCSKKCHEPCIPCVENCSWSCPHRGACNLPCAVPCDMLPCSKRCSLTLSCGHGCPSVCGETCPQARYCQKCADKSIKDMMVDYIMGSTYAEIDLNENPCIIPSCGHILTLESMDGHIELTKYYTISNDTNAEDSIIALKSSSVPFSTPELKNCPMCRSPLRNINRYGRIVRRAWIDEATKKFIVWANSHFVPLALRMEQAEASLREPVTEKQNIRPPLLEQVQLHSALDKLSLEPIRLIGSRDEQIKVVLKAFKTEARYKDIFLLRNAIKRFLQEVDEAEQPISRIHDLVQDARKHHGVNTDIADLPSVLQVRNRLLATVLLLRCDYAILLNFVTHSARTALGKNFRDLRLNLALNRKDCENLIQESRTKQQPTHEVEGLLYWAHFAALERGRSASLSDADISTLVDRAHNQLHLALTICNTYPGQTVGMLAEVSEAEKMLRDATFYASVTNAEKAAVYAAMAQSFQGTGHWYYCVNGHPFTVGECGMPMQTARCPQCEATVGGTNHQAVAGVTRATDLEAEFGRRGW
ncbi:MAG: NF-X1 finger and helicase domain [Lasallia pustulata]|uniref:NF-X1 finger and helicase domain n=1 Tax=Lasallia pustulata TaxID=136370 RepID=A0A5M8PND2_9LECA|nr:MAG: NF-X1 finger and helicase domain [Lasallia pustulata]